MTLWAWFILGTIHWFDIDWCWCNDARQNQLDPYSLYDEVIRSIQPVRWSFAAEANKNSPVWRWKNEQHEIEPRCQATDLIDAEWKHVYYSLLVKRNIDKNTTNVSQSTSIHRTLFVKLRPNNFSDTLFQSSSSIQRYWTAYGWFQRQATFIKQPKVVPMIPEAAVQKWPNKLASLRKVLRRWQSSRPHPHDSEYNKTRLNYQ